MEIQFKKQKFQAEAAKAVIDVFVGQPNYRPSFMLDIDKNNLSHESDVGYCNHKIIPALSDELILSNIQNVQREQQIEPSKKLEGRYNLTIEMETGVGKTYTYIKTMYELSKNYGWNKFIIVVPSIAIREGVYKTFQNTEKHFSEEYGKKINYFIYNSSNLDDIYQFASSSTINVMIINSQAFNAKGKDARRIFMELDSLNSKRPISLIAQTNPIIIIDEPQSVEGKQTKIRLKEFNPLFTLRYSATHKSDSRYNMIYRLDAMEAYNKHLVKKIAVKGISEVGTTATDGYVYLENINLSENDPTASLEFEIKRKSGIKKTCKTVAVGDNLFHLSGELEEYRNNFTITNIDGLDDSIEFANGIKLRTGEVIGQIDELQLRRIQIRETIDSHLLRERALFHKGIKVLSLFFIDEVAKYKGYDDYGNQYNGIYAQIFEEEYKHALHDLMNEKVDPEYVKYLNSIEASQTHAGYFSIDKKKRMIDSKVGKKETTSDDADAYNLIMKNKELLLNQDPAISPVRFIFSHSALREGWDNPNVFQICTLKQSSSDVRKRQEVGRGLRLCVNQQGERMDESVLGNDVHTINVLTIIASESYDSFSQKLQKELAEAVGDRPKSVTQDLFLKHTFVDVQGNNVVLTQEAAQEIYIALRNNGYVDKEGKILQKYHDDKKLGLLQFAEEASGFEDAVTMLLDSVYNDKIMEPENARSNNIELSIDEKRLGMPEFKALWEKINSKSVYIVNFNTNELVKKSAEALNNRLKVPKIYFNIEQGELSEISSKEQLQKGKAFVFDGGTIKQVQLHPCNSIEYDLVGRLVEETELTRKTIINILTSITKATFDKFKDNPEEFIIQSSKIINEEKASVIVQHITYHALEERYNTDIFTAPSLRGKLDVNALKTRKHLYDHVLYDSNVEKEFAMQLDSNGEIAVYVKLPSGFFINTPVGNYNPDWAIAFYEGSVKHIYFVAETKGTMNSLQLRKIEQTKIDCARKHFKAISNDEVRYDVVDSYRSLMDMILS